MVNGESTGLGIARCTAVFDVLLCFEKAAFQKLRQQSHVPGAIITRINNNCRSSHEAGRRPGIESVRGRRPCCAPFLRLLLTSYEYEYVYDRR